MQPTTLDRLTVLAAQQLGILPEEVDQTAALDRLFDEAGLNAFLARARFTYTSEGEFRRMWHAACRRADREKSSTIVSSLQVLSAFDRQAKNELEQQTWRLECPSLASLSATLDAGKPIYSGHLREDAHAPYSAKAVKFWATGILLFPLLAGGIAASTPCTPVCQACMTQVAAFSTTVGWTSNMVAFLALAFIGPGLWHLGKQRRPRAQAQPIAVCRREGD